MAEAQGNKIFLSLVLEALFTLEISKREQEENPSWLSSQESKEGADPENVPDIEDFWSARPQLLLFTSSVLYLQPAPLHSFFFCATSFVFSVFPLSNCFSSLPQEHSRANPHLPCSLPLPASGYLPGLFSFHNQIFSSHEFLIPIRNFPIPCAGVFEKTVVYWFISKHS